MNVSELGIAILKILHEKQKDEHVYLKSCIELQKFDKDEIQDEAQKLTEEGYVTTYRTSQLIEMDHNLVNFFFEITDAGRQILHEASKFVS